MPSQTHTATVQNGSGAQVARGTTTKTANGEIEFGSTIANSGNDVYTMAVVPGDVVALWILSTRNVTVNINDDGSPDQVISLVANVPLTWHNGMGTTCPITATISSMKVLNASGASAVVSGAFLLGI